MRDGDGERGGLVGTVHRFRRRGLESNACWKATPGVVL